MKAGIIHFFFILGIFLIVIPTSSFALTINEVYPAPSNDESEWVEIYNESPDTIDLSAYALTDATGKQILFESNTIADNGFIIAASKNVLNNTGDTVTLNDKDGNVLDSVSYPDSINDKKSYVRCPDGLSGVWTTTETITKSATNQPSCQNTTPTTSPLPAGLNPTTSQPTSSQQIYSNVYLSEVMSYPVSGDHEWIELYNNNDFEVVLTDWHIDDMADSGSSPKTFSLTIAARSYGVVDLSSAIFNNDGDSVRLLDQDNNLKDTISYSTNKQGKTIGKTSLQNSYACLQEPSRNNANTGCIITNGVTATTIPKISQGTSPTIIRSQVAMLETEINNLTDTSGATVHFAGENSMIKLRQPADELASQIETGSVLGQFTKTIKSNGQNIANLMSFVKGLSASAYLLSLLATTLLIKRTFKKYQMLYL